MVIYQHQWLSRYWLYWKINKLIGNFPKDKHLDLKQMLMVFAWPKTLHPFTSTNDCQHIGYIGNFPEDKHLDLKQMLMVFLWHNTITIYQHQWLSTYQVYWKLGKVNKLVGGEVKQINTKNDRMEGACYILWNWNDLKILGPEEKKQRGERP